MAEPPGKPTDSVNADWRAGEAEYGGYNIGGVT